MPDYEYRCTKCEKTFTVRETFEQHDRHRKVRCPECNGVEVERVLTPVMGKTSRKS